MTNIVLNASGATAPVREPGQQLRRARERLHLKYRDVEQASRQIANGHGNDQFVVGLSRLADIENHGTVPSIYRLYSLCAIYCLDFKTVLLWYCIDLGNMAADYVRSPHSHTHSLDIPPCQERALEIPDLAPEVDFRRTCYLSREIQRWGKLPLSLLNTLDLQRQRYGFVGTDDWSMYPILAPGSFLQIDEKKRKIATDGWPYETERPIYFVDHRIGYACGWCTQKDGLLIVQPHSSSQTAPQVFRYPGDAEVIGQVVGVAMRLDLPKRRHTRS